MSLKWKCSENNMISANSPFGLFKVWWAWPMSEENDFPYYVWFGGYTDTESGGVGEFNSLEEAITKCQELFIFYNNG